jgi:hypothetical protein
LEAPPPHRQGPVFFFFSRSSFVKVDHCWHSQKWSCHGTINVAWQPRQWCLAFNWSATGQVTAYHRARHLQEIAVAASFALAIKWSQKVTPCCLHNCSRGRKCILTADFGKCATSCLFCVCSLAVRVSGVEQTEAEYQAPVPSHWDAGVKTGCTRLPQPASRSWRERTQLPAAELLERRTMTYLHTSLKKAAADGS